MHSIAEDTQRRRQAFVDWAIISTIVIECITLLLRFRGGITAVDFNATAPPLLLQIHHMFWAVPLLPGVVWYWRRPTFSGALAGLAIGLIASDLLHHFAFLPLLVGNTGWHWP